MHKVFTVNLSSGESLKGSYWLAKQPVVNLVMQTGMQEYSARYEEMASYLNSKGINVYILDAFGQGHNAESIERQQIWPKDAFRKNVDAMYLKLEEVKSKSGLPTVIMGHSMGSFMTQSYIERYPNTADKVVLFGTNGPVSIYPLAKFLGDITTNRFNRDKPSHFLATLAMGTYKSSIKNRKTDLDWLSANEDNVKKYMDDPYCGHPATCGFFKEFFTGLNTLYKKKNLANISKDEHIMLMAGEGDPVGAMGKGPRKLAELYKKLGVKDVNLIIYPNMRHEIHNEKDHEKVYKDLAEFILK